MSTYILGLLGFCTCKLMYVSLCLWRASFGACLYFVVYMLLYNVQEFHLVSLVGVHRQQHIEQRYRVRFQYDGHRFPGDLQSGKVHRNPFKLERLLRVSSAGLVWLPAAASRHQASQSRRVYRADDCICGHLPYWTDRKRLHSRGHRQKGFDENVDELLPVQSGHLRHCHPHHRQVTQSSRLIITCRPTSARMRKKITRRIL